jgi:hypothetical protein
MESCNQTRHFPWYVLGFSAALSKGLERANGESKDSFVLKPRGGVDWARHTGALATDDLLFDSYHYPQLTRPSSSASFTHLTLFICLQVVLVVAADVEAVALKAVEEVALKAVGIVVVGEVGEAPIAVAVVALHQSTELEFPMESVPIFGPPVLATAHSTAGSSMKPDPRCPWYPRQRQKINRQTFSLGKD